MTSIFIVGIFNRTALTVRVEDDGRGTFLRKVANHFVPVQNRGSNPGRVMT
jgi:hypothetical protein